MTMLGKKGKKYDKNLAGTITQFSRYIGKVFLLDFDNRTTTFHLIGKLLFKMISVIYFFMISAMIFLLLMFVWYRG